MAEANADICPLVFSLCQQRNVPVLVTDRLAQYLDERDLLTISILSRTLHEQAAPIIYHNISLDFSNVEHCEPEATLLLRALVTNTKAAQSIRRLSLTGDPLYEWRREKWAKAIREGGEGVEHPVHGRTPPEIPLRVADFAREEIQSMQSKARSLRIGIDVSESSISLSSLCLVILRLAPFLTDLQISSDYFRYPHFRDELRNSLTSGLLQNLRSCSFCLDIPDGGRCRHINAAQGWDDTLLQPFKSPHMDSISTVMTLHPDAIRVLRTSTITRLILHHCQIADFDVDGLLAATPKLTCLKYHVSLDYGLYHSSWHRSGMRRKLGLHPLFDALHHVCDTLTELVTSQAVTEDSHHFEGDALGHESFFRQCYELSELKYLRTLSIPYQNLLGWNYNDDRTYEWHKLLPASLHQLTITDDFEQNNLGGNWEDAKLLPIFSDLVVWLATYAQRNRPLELRLLLLHEDTEFKEPMRQYLSQICEAYGIWCSIEKHNRDFGS